MSASLLATNTDPRADLASAYHRELIAWLLAYASNGHRVIPCNWQKRPLIKGWPQAATTDPHQIQMWWETWPLAMIGFPTGERSGRAVLDVDRKNGVDGFATMQANGWTVPEDAIEVRTPSGGSHFYFRYSGTERNSAGKIGPGLDIRGQGGYVIAPPSRPTLDGPDYHYAEGQNLEMGVL